MKKLGIIFVIIAMFALIGCQTTGGASASSGGGAEPFVVDLSKLTSVKSENNVKIEDQLQSGNYQTQSALRNQTPFAKAWDDFFILLPASALPSDFFGYNRLTITCKYFDAAGAEIEQQDSQCLVVVVYDMKGDLRGPQMDAGPNTPVKEMNVGGFSARIHTDRGVRVTFKQAPHGVMFQNNSGSKVAFIEMTGMVFHNGNYESPKE
jgi:hypothetical protein